MNNSLSLKDLSAYVSNQINYLFPDNKPINLSSQTASLADSLDRLNYCFRHITIKHYCVDGVAIFNHLFSNQYATFLWFLSNTIWKKTQDQALCNKLFYANKALNSFECMYDTNLPDIFFLSHTVGTVLGKASYANYFVISQGCTVGVHAGIYPIFGIGVALAANSSVIGNCVIGDQVSVGSNTHIFATNIPHRSNVYTNNQGIQKINLSPQSCYAQNFFNVDLNAVSISSNHNLNSSKL